MPSHGFPMWYCRLSDVYQRERDTEHYRIDHKIVTRKTRPTSRNIIFQGHFGSLGIDMMNEEKAR